MKMLVPSSSLSSLSNLFWFLSILFSAFTIAAQDISPGSTLYASNPQQSWNSPNNSFSLSFIEEPENTYFAAVTYNGVPVWKAGGDPGGSVDSSAALRFLSDGNLQLTTGRDSLVWQSNTSGLGITSLSLENSGNLVLKNGSNFPVWTSFNNPSDTILPDQNFTVNHRLRCGSYSFRLSPAGVISLRWNDSVEYYNNSNGINSSGTFSNLTSPSLGMQSVGIFSLYDPSLSNAFIVARSNDYGEVSENTLKFVKLDCDGNMRIYTSSTSSGRGNRIVRWTAVSDQCEVFGYCGNFGVCRYGETGSEPFCECPSRNFERVDPKDGRKGCRRKDETQNCQRTVLELNNTLLLTYPPDIDREFFTATMTACRSNCLADSSCLASSSLADGSGVCYMKRSDMISGYTSPTLTSTSFVMVCGSAVPNAPFSSSGPDRKLSDSLKVAVVVLSTVLVLVILVGGMLWFYTGSKSKYESLLSQYSFSDYASGVPIQFSYRELQNDTKGFKDKLGGGGFGSVYRGVLSNKMVVAVKRLEGIGQGEKQFRMEVATISSTHHMNLVRLIGFCSEGKHRLLVYEFMKNGSLDRLLFSDTNALDWSCRFRIAVGTAKGITYLHEECRDRILHCDIKPENILLDGDFNARISDFGLAKLLNLNDQRRRSLINVRGTRGYLAPEWVANSPITSKADVYSYGMVLLEIVSGRRNFEVCNETNMKRFSLWAYEEFEKGNISSLLDKRLSEEDVDMVQATRAVQVSFWCIQEQPSLRPTMGRVVQMLEGIADVRKPPPPLPAVEGFGQIGVPIVSSFASE